MDNEKFRSEISYSPQSPVAETVPLAAVSDVPSPRPRVWPLAVIILVSAVSFLLGSGFSLLLAQLVATGSIATSREAAVESFEMIKDSRLAFTITVIGPQIALVLPSLLAAFGSPQRFGLRLGLVRGHWPLWGWFAAAAATPLVGMLVGGLVGLFLEESPALKETAELFRRIGTGGFLIPLAMMIGGMPAICEELLFRGYLQTRLTKRFPPVLGILLASAVFAIFHMDPVHVIAVFPIGLWMGWLSFRSGSIFPAMIAHLVNNVLAVVGVVLNPAENIDTLALPTAFAMLFILAAGVLGVLGVAAAVFFFPPPSRESELPAGTATDAGLL